PRLFPPLHARFEIPEHGEIDFIPTNRWARATLSAAVPGGSLEPIAVEGAYDVRRDEAGTWIRGANGASGAAFVRFALVDRSLPPGAAPRDAPRRDRRARGSAAPRGERPGAAGRARALAAAARRGPVRRRRRARAPRSDGGAHVDPLPRPRHVPGDPPSR